MVSIDVYFPIIRILLPTRFDYRSELDESTIDSLLFWAIGISGVCSSTSWTGELLALVINVREELMIVESD